MACFVVGQSSRHSGTLYCISPICRIFLVLSLFFLHIIYWCLHNIDAVILMHSSRLSSSNRQLIFPTHEILRWHNITFSWCLPKSLNLDKLYAVFLNKIQGSSNLNECNKYCPFPYGTYSYGRWLCRKRAAFYCLETQMNKCSVMWEPECTSKPV